MNRWLARQRWEARVLLRSFGFRAGRTALLVAVLTMAASLVIALGIVSATIGSRVAEEVRNYGANLLLLPESARIEVGSGGLAFGGISEPAYLEQPAVERLLARHGEQLAGASLHLRGTLRRGSDELPVEGVRFAEVRRLAPWWQVRGRWPERGEALVGSDVATLFGVKEGDALPLAGPGGELALRVAGIVTTGGEEDKLLFLDLAEAQGALGLAGRLTSVRLLAHTGREPLAQVAARMEADSGGARVREVRQVARTSEALLQKVQLLMALVTAVVVLSSAGSVAGTMSTTVLERGREIGLMKAMGGSRRQVLALFVREALAFGLCGGMLGFLVGNVIAELVTRTVFAASITFMLPFFPVALAVSLGIALLGSLGPLLTVYRLDPAQSLRGE